MITGKKWYRVRDVADILEVSPQRVSQMLKADLIPHYRINHTCKIDRQEFAQWLEARHRGTHTD